MQLFWNKCKNIRGEACIAMLVCAQTAIIATMPASAFGGGVKAEPRIELSANYWYFGFMPQNVSVQHTFWIRNVGLDTLRIEKVTPGCGCTTAPLSRKAIPAGDSAKLRVVFDSRNMFGRMVKEVLIESNDPKTPKATIKFLAATNQEHPNLKINPNGLRFMRTASGKMLKRLELMSSSNEKIKIRVVDYPRNMLRLSAEELELRPNTHGILDAEQLIIVQDDSEVLNSLTLETGIGDQLERITIPIVFVFDRPILR